MKLLSTIGVCLLLTGYGFSQARTVPKQQIPVDGTRASLVPPDGFTASSQFPGFTQESTYASILVTEFPASFIEASSAFSSTSALSERGMVLIEKQQVSVSGQAGILALVMHNISGTEYLKWILVLGDEKESVLITAAFSKELERQLSDKMKASVLTAKWDREKNIAPTEGLTFSITEKGELRIAKRTQDRLRQSGFVFVELFTQDLSGYINFFQAVAGFKLIRKEGTFVQLQSERSEILLNSTKIFPKGHPFRGKVPGQSRVVVVEIGIVVADLDKAHATARKFKGWRLVAGIARQPWGPRDFRVLSPDGYYLRFTE